MENMKEFERDILETRGFCRRYLDVLVAKLWAAGVKAEPYED